MAKLTQAEAAELILSAFTDYQRKHLIPPTLRELCALTHFSLAALDYRLTRMERDGLIVREPYVARGIRVVREPRMA